MKSLLVVGFSIALLFPCSLTASASTSSPVKLPVQLAGGVGGGNFDYEVDVRDGGAGPGPTLVLKGAKANESGKVFERVDGVLQYYGRWSKDGDDVKVERNGDDSLVLEDMATGAAGGNVTDPLPNVDGNYTGGCWHEK